MDFVKNWLHFVKAAGIGPYLASGRTWWARARARAGDGVRVRVRHRAVPGGRLGRARCNPMHPTLQPYASHAATPRIHAATLRIHAATLRIPRCNPMWQVGASDVPLLDFCNGQA
eukprot:scaffold40885_cov44-Phaeocystis_antarctica.AAC.1